MTDKCSECGGSTRKYGTTIRMIDCVQDGELRNIQIKVKRTRCLDSVCQNIDYIYPKPYEKSELGMYTKDYVDHILERYASEKITPYILAQSVGKSYGTIKRILGL